MGLPHPPPTQLSLYSNLFNLFWLFLEFIRVSYVFGNLAYLVKYRTLNLLLGVLNMNIF